MFTNVFSDHNAKPITVKFKNGQIANYTTNILELLKRDTDTEYIMDSETGEIIFHYQFNALF